MPRYYFDFTEGNFARDDAGLEFDGVDAARDEAARTLGEMAKYALPGKAAHDMAIEVRGEDGQPLFTARLRFEIQPPGTPRDHPGTPHDHKESG
jgi:hypothetical protein